MNKYIFFVLFTLSLFITSCKNNIPKKIVTNLTIDNFNLKQFSINGDIVYSIKSPKSIFLQAEKLYQLNNANIKFFENKEIKYMVYANNAYLLNNNKILKLNGDIKILDFEINKTTIEADNFYWDISKSEYILEGNVRLDNKYIKLISSKAYLNKNNNIIEFFNPVKYYYKEKNSTTKYNISSENAYYDLINKTVIFKSENDRVKSKIVF